MDQTLVARVSALSNSFQAQAKLLARLAEESEQAAHLMREIVNLLLGRSGDAVPPVWGVITDLTFVPDLAGNGPGALVDQVPLDLIDVDLETLRVLAEPGVIAGDDGFEYKPTEFIAAAVAERLRRPVQSLQAVTASLCRIRGALQAIRTDGRRLIVYRRSVGGYRLARPARNNSPHTPASRSIPVPVRAR
ncbi:MAG: hypothetical protein AB7I50_01735 [Vicinamibacterales bacterium]